MANPRPERTYKTGNLTKGFRIVGIAAVIVISIALGFGYPHLPETVATHFTFSGDVDEYGSKTSVLWMALVFVVLQLLLAWLSTKPRSFNYPVYLDENNAQALYREGERLMVWIAGGISVLYAGLVLMYFVSWGLAILMLGLALIVIALIVGIVRMVRAGKTV